MNDKYTLQLFRFLLNKKPVGLTDDLVDEGEGLYSQLSASEYTEQQVEASVIAYGKKVWAYRQAAATFAEQFGKEKHDEFFVSLLSPELAKKWQEFAGRGWSVRDFREGNRFEQFFTPEENVAIEQASIETEKAMYDYLTRLATGEQKQVYDGLLAQYKQEQAQIEGKIEELKKCVSEPGEKWDAELAGAVLFFERGLAEIEARPTVQKVQEKIDFYQGQKSTGNV